VRAEPNDEGPFYYEASLLRRTIAERLPDVPLWLGITLGCLAAAPGCCFSLASAVVDVWHTSPSGLYSNVGRDLQPIDTAGQTFLRACTGWNRWQTRSSIWPVRSSHRRYAPEGWCGGGTVGRSP
jgi:hypothetical protein